ncbi:MAG: hypothetical protein COX29_00810 [Candidatus Moranbacteria bacterium CG23_combo_of_CG06-09_8_20_14_all_35_22]|nr:MAG: hypothetical protein COX29_00810 [Candidatus Moranbacteria bacterium CG23_combo_of_CG06-09_8_20_14_all_35_22]
MKSYFGKISLIVASIFFLSGCDFLSSQKEEVKLENNKILEIKKEESTDNLEENIQENISTDNSRDDTKEKNEVKDAESVPQIINKLVDWGFSKSENRKIDTIIIHSSYNAVGKDSHNLEDIIYKEYKPYGVSPHYIISRDGKIYRLVLDKNIAYHAGESKVPDGRTSVNNFSLGIEIVNTKSEKPNEAQYNALRNLLTYLKSEYKIKYMLGHSDIAPSRKDDPWNFDFERVK